MSLPYYVEPEYWAEGYAEGDAKLASAAVSASSAVDVLGVRVRLSSGQVTASAAASADCVRVLDASTEIDAALSTSAAAVSTRVGAFAAFARTSTAAACLRARRAKGALRITSSTEASGERIGLPEPISIPIVLRADVTAREKWEIDPDTAETWVRQYAGSGDLYVLPGYWQDGYVILWYPEVDTAETWTRLN